MYVNIYIYAYVYVYIYIYIRISPARTYAQGGKNHAP